jgi:hypothetical protein
MTQEKYQPSARCGWTYVEVLPHLVGHPWDEITRAYLRALRPTWIRVVGPDGSEKTDGVPWRVTIYLSSSNQVERIMQEIEVDLPEGVRHGADLDWLVEQRAQTGKGGLR